MPNLFDTFVLGTYLAITCEMKDTVGCVVIVFSLNRIIFLAERQAFTHCCEPLQV